MILKHKCSLSQNTDQISGSHLIYFYFKKVCNCHWDTSHWWERIQWSKTQHFISLVWSMEKFPKVFFACTLLRI